MTSRPSIKARYERVTDPAMLELMRRAFRRLNRGMVLLFRLGLGRWADAWPSFGGRVLVVEHRGRRTGRRLLTPLNYAPDGDAVYCVAAFGGGADWYRNVLAEPDLALWLPAGRRRAHGVDVSAHPSRIALIRAVLVDSGFAARAVGMDPIHMTDEEIAGATTDYRVVRFDLAEPLPRVDDLRWVWPVGGVALLALLGAARLRRR